VLEAVKVWPGKVEACRKVGATANLDSFRLRIDVNGARVETTNGPSNQEIHEGKDARLHQIP